MPTTRRNGAQPNAAELRFAIDRAVEVAGTLKALAERCGVSAPAIAKAHRTGRISAQLARRIHLATKGKVPASRLRPDLWRSPAAVRGYRGRSRPAVNKA